LEKSDHNDDDDVEMREEPHPQRRSLSSGSRMSTSSASVAPTTPGEDFYGLSGEEAGGISDGAGEVGERLALSGRKVDVKASGSRRTFGSSTCHLTFNTSSILSSRHV